MSYEFDSFALRKKEKFRSSGFTLIELIISVGVIVLMLAVSLPAFTDFQRRQDLLSAAQIIRDSITSAQNYTLAPRGSESDAGKTPDADYYRIVFNEDTTDPDKPKAQYLIQEQRNTAIAFSNIDWMTLKEGTLPETISFCGFDPAELKLDPPPTDPALQATRGIIYSIRELGKIVEDTGGGAIQPKNGELKIYLKHRTLTGAKLVTVRAETGQVDITDIASCPS